MTASELQKKNSDRDRKRDIALPRLFEKVAIEKAALTRHTETL